jgi:hypothetical protein
MAIRVYNGKSFEDRRQWFSFTLPDKRKAATKALTVEEAKSRIEETLKLKLAA